MSSGSDVKKKVGILTYHAIANNGAALFAFSLCAALQEGLPEFKVGLVNFQPREMYWYEIIKQAKLHKNAPFFNFRRHKIFKKFVREELCIDAESLFTTDEVTAINLLSMSEYEMVITAMDVWNISNIPLLPKFPNIYWLPEPIRAKKIAYAVSGYRSDDAMVDDSLDEVRSLLNSFDLIGVRDDYTRAIVQASGASAVVPPIKVPDPTFMYEIRETSVSQSIKKKGIDLSKPILGILIYGKPEFSRQIRTYYHLKGFQMVALSMYNPFVDVNLGHVLDPHEWAEVFKYFTFCITDRFHGAIFCLKNKIPFVAIEPDPLPSLAHSKVYPLLKEFDLQDCYLDVYAEDFEIEKFFNKSEELENLWESQYSLGIDGKLEEMKARNSAFIQQIRNLLSA